MPDALPVQINREEVHAIEAAPSFETDGTFVVRLENHGSPTHVHVHLDGPLGEAATLDATNHFVEEADSHDVAVEVDQDRLPARGSIEVMTGYGAESATVDVSLVKREEVIVDESLAEPAEDGAGDGAADPGESGDLTGESESGGIAGVTSREFLPVAALGVVAVGLAVAVATTVSDTATAAVAVAALLLGVVAAAYLLVAG